MTPNSTFPPSSLAVVALPLGNTGDVTQRAIAVLSRADWVAAEDTRSVGRFLASLGIRTRLLSYHDWNEGERASRLLEHLNRGARVALVSEAGTPGISDPGYEVVALARQTGLKVFPVPGASALVAFLSVSGLPTDRFTFLGFPPRKEPKLRSFLASYADRRETLVFYESPRRILATLDQAREVFGARLCALGREMTKPHEEFLFGPLPAVIAGLRDRASIRGEICWGVAGADPTPQRAGDEEIRRIAEAVSGEEMPMKARARKLAARCGISVKEAYSILTRQSPFG